jgi:hypothetical protein
VMFMLYTYDVYVVYNNVLNVFCDVNVVYM